MNYDTVIIGAGRQAVREARRVSTGSDRVVLIVPSDNSAPTSTHILPALKKLGQPAGNCWSRLQQEVRRLMQIQGEQDLAQLTSQGVDVVRGQVRFDDSYSISVTTVDGKESISGESFVLACGTAPRELGHLPFDGQRILSPDDLLSLPQAPGSAVVIGAGKKGLETATLLARLGIAVTVVDEHANQFDLCGGLMSLDLLEAQSLNIAFRLGDEVIGVEGDSGPAMPATIRLASGRRLTADAVVVAIGRVGRTAGMNLEVAGVGIDEHGRVWCDAQGQTWAPHITAVGDVIGFRTAVGLAG